MNWNMHMAQGALPSAEHGIDLSIRTHRMGNQVFAIARVGTPWGPVSLMAQADMATVNKILGATGDALHKLCARMATEGVMKKVAEVTCSPQKSAAAERLLARIRAKDPKAMASAKKLITMGRQGHPGASEGLACLKQAYAKAKAVKVTAPPSMSGCAGTMAAGSMDSPLRGASYNPFEGDGSGFASRLPFPFPHAVGPANVIAGDASGFTPHLPFPFASVPHSPEGGYVVASGDKAGFASRLPPPFFQTTTPNIMAGTQLSGAVHDGWNGWQPYHPIPYGRVPTSYPHLPMGPYRGMAAGIQNRQEASYIAGVLTTGKGSGITGQGLSALLALSAHHGK
jgi:hypothetical protein